MKIYKHINYSKRDIKLCNKYLSKPTVPLNPVWAPCQHGGNMDSSNVWQVNAYRVNNVLLCSLYIIHNPCFYYNQYHNYYLYYYYKQYYYYSYYFYFYYYYFVFLYVIYKYYKIPFYLPYSIHTLLLSLFVLLYLQLSLLILLSYY